ARKAGNPAFVAIFSFLSSVASVAPDVAVVDISGCSRHRKAGSSLAMPSRSTQDVRRALSSGYKSHLTNAPAGSSRRVLRSTRILFPNKSALPASTLLQITSPPIPLTSSKWTQPKSYRYGRGGVFVSRYSGVREAANPKCLSASSGRLARSDDRRQRGSKESFRTDKEPQPKSARSVKDHLSISSGR